MCPQCTTISITWGKHCALCFCFQNFFISSYTQKTCTQSLFLNALCKHLGSLSFYFGSFEWGQRRVIADGVGVKVLILSANCSHLFLHPRKRRKRRKNKEKCEIIKTTREVPSNPPWEYPKYGSNHARIKQNLKKSKSGKLRYVGSFLCQFCSHVYRGSRSGTLKRAGMIEKEIASEWDRETGILREIPQSGL